jgi:hypothetical protein
MMKPLRLTEPDVVGVVVETDSIQLSSFLSDAINRITEVAKAHKVIDNSFRSIAFHGVFQSLDVVNRNRRIYPKEPYLRALKEVQNKIEMGVFYGELDHHDGPITFEHASHLITEVRVQENLVYGKAITLPTPAGQVITNLLLSKFPVGMSVDGYADVQEAYDEQAGGTIEVVSMVEIDSYDAVPVPGHKEAYVQAVRESYRGLSGSSWSEFMAHMQEEIDYFVLLGIKGAP